MTEPTHTGDPAIEPLAELEAVVFDLDDTLYLETDYVRSGFRAVAAVLADKGGDAEPIRELLWRAFEQGPRERVFNSVLKELGRSEDGALIEGLVKCYREHRPVLQLEEPMRELLGRLRGLYRLGLLTDGFLPAQRYKVEALELADAFDCIIYTEQLGRAFWKPAVAGFELMSEKLGCKGSGCVYVADNVKKDFIGPHRLGWRTIRLVRPGQVHNDGPGGGQAQFPGPEGGSGAQYVARGPESLAVLLGV